MNPRLATLALLALAAAARADNPFAASVVSSVGLAGVGTYDDPAALLGKPTTRFGSPGFFERTKLVEGNYGTAPDGSKILTKIDEGQSVTVSFDHLVRDDAANPYGLDLIVFGNSFFLGNDFADDSTNLNAFTLTGDVYGVGMKVSVSLDGVDWRTFDGGPYANGLLPTNAYRWDRANARWTDQEADWTKPVNPTLIGADFAGLSAADALDLYEGSAGGTGYDLASVGLSAIRYVRVTGVPGHAGGVIDGFADAAPVPEPASLLVLGLGAALLRCRRR